MQIPISITENKKIIYFCFDPFSAIKMFDIMRTLYDLDNIIFFAGSMGYGYKDFLSTTETNPFNILDLQNCYSKIITYYNLKHYYIFDNIDKFNFANGDNLFRSSFRYDYYSGIKKLLQEKNIDFNTIDFSILDLTMLDFNWYDLAQAQPQSNIEFAKMYPALYKLYLDYLNLSQQDFGEEVEAIKNFIDDAGLRRKIITEIIKSFKGNGRIFYPFSDLLPSQIKNHWTLRQEKII